MISTLQDVVRRVQATPGQAAAFGAAVGGLFALMAFNLLGVAFVAAWLPAPAFMILAQAIGAGVAWAAVSRR